MLGLVKRKEKQPGSLMTTLSCWTHSRSVRAQGRHSRIASHGVGPQCGEICSPLHVSFPPCYRCRQASAEGRVPAPATPQPTHPAHPHAPSLLGSACSYHFPTLAQGPVLELLPKDINIPGGTFRSLSAPFHLHDLLSHHHCPPRAPRHS